MLPGKGWVVWRVVVWKADAVRSSRSLNAISSSKISKIWQPERLHESPATRACW